MLFSTIRAIVAIFKEYTDQAFVFAIVFSVLYVAYIVIDLVIRLIKHKKLHSIGYVLMKTCLFALLGIYLSYILALTFSGREIVEYIGVKNLDPFSTIIRNGSLNPEIFQNFIMLLPLGMLIPATFKYLRGPVRTTLAGLTLSVSIEVAQIIFKRGYFDVDDIIFNTLGAFAGYVLFAGLYDGMLGIKRRIITDAAKKLKITPPLGKLYDRFALKHAIVLFIVQLAPVFLWGNIIMGFSSDDGEQSAALSGALLSFILRILVGDAQVTQQEETDISVLWFFEGILRKMAHIFEYAVFALLVWALLYSIRRLAKIFVYGLALASAFVIGMIDETNQMSVYGRMGSYKDVLIDMSGSVVVLTITFVIVRIITNYYIKKHSPR